jgi:mono/diheme cytochrome c family protein
LRHDRACAAYDRLLRDGGPQAWHVGPGVAAAAALTPRVRPEADVGAALPLENKDMNRVLSFCTAMIVLMGITAAAQDQVARGIKVYADQKCNLCHSIAGKGNTKGKLDAVGSTLSADDLRAWIVDAKGMTAKTKAPRKPEMKNYDLPKADVDALVAYLSTLKKK